VLAHGDEALLRQLVPDFEDRSIAFDPKLVKQVPDVELTPGNFAQTRGVPQDVVVMGDRVRYHLQTSESHCEIGGIRSAGTAARTVSPTRRLFWVSPIKMVAPISTAVATRITARRKSKARCSLDRSSAISPKWGT
jgi:hypothetical protein